MRQNFRAPWDWKLIATTTGLLLFLGGLIFLKLGPIPSVIMWSIILGCAAFGVYGYSIQKGQLEILRLGWSKKIDLDEITNIEAKPHAMMGSIRTFANGGLFGYVGNFRNSILGSYKAYATKGENTVVIETTDHDKIVVTPDDPDKFIECLDKQLYNW